MSKEDILEAIANMSVMEVVELISAMEEKFGVTAAAAVAVAAPGAGDAGVVRFADGLDARPGLEIATGECFVPQLCQPIHEIVGLTQAPAEVHRCAAKPVEIQGLPFQGLSLDYENLAHAVHSGRCLARRARLAGMVAAADRRPQSAAGQRLPLRCKCVYWRSPIHR